MKLEVIVKGNSRRNRVERMPTGEFRVSVTTPQHEGRANDAVVEAVALFFEVPPSRVKLLLGHKGRRKLIEVVE